MTDYFEDIKDYLRNLYWKFQHRFNPRRRYHVVKTDLPPGYYDPDTRIIHACFTELKRFVERHPQLCEVKEDEPYWVEAKELYDWWVNERPHREDDWFEEHPLSDDVKIGSPEMREFSEALWKAEKEWDDEDYIMLVRLMKIRKYLWYP